MITDVTAFRSHPAALVLAVLLVLLASMPPEVHGEAAAGAAALIAIAVLVQARAVAPVRAGWFLVATLLAIPIARAAEAKGAAVAPIVTVLACVAANLAAASLPLSIRSLPFWPGLIAAAGAAVAARAVWEVAFGLDRMRAAVAAAADVVERDLLIGRIDEGRAYAGFPTPAALGGFLALSLAITAGAAASRTGRTRLWLAAAAVLEGAGLLASRSLTAAGALVVAAALVAVRSEVSSSKRRRWAIAAGFALVILIGTVALRGRGAVDATQQASPWALRWGNVRAAAAMVADHPWLGVGPGGYAEAYPRYRRVGENTTRHAHSLPFELAAEAGLPVGGVLTVIFFAAFLGPALRRPRDAAEAGAAAGLAAFALQNLGDFTALLPSTLGVAAIVRGLHARQPDPPAHQSVAKPAVVAFAGASLIACVLFGLDGIGANRRREARAAFAAGEAARALHLTTRAVALAPWHPDGPLYRAQILERTGDSRSEAEIERALALAPSRSSALATRARLRARAGDLGGALGDIEAAARLHPTDLEYARARDDLARRIEQALPQ